MTSSANVVETRFGRTTSVLNYLFFLCPTWCSERFDYHIVVLLFLNHVSYFCSTGYFGCFDHLHSEVLSFEA